MSESFESPSQRRAFVQLCVSTFLLFTTGSTLALLSLVLERNGHSSREIGIVLSSPIAPVIIAILVTGRLLRSLNPLQVAFAGQVLMILSFAGFEWWIRSTVGGAICRAVFGLGFGVYFAASTFVARDMLRGPRTTYLFGLFGSMITLPNAIGPAAAEFVLDHVGLRGYFLWLSVPGLLAVAILGRLCVTHAVSRSTIVPPPVSYLSFFRSGAFRLASATNFVMGISWGMVFGYCALHLRSHGILVGAFFSSMTLAFFTTRFVLMTWIQKRPREEAVAGAFVCMALSFIALGAFPTIWTAVVAGLVFGIGYSAVSPILSVWASDVFPATSRPMAMALFNTHFHVGFFAFPIFMGSLASLQKLDRTLIALGLLSLLTAGWYSMCALRPKADAAIAPVN
ncbi:MFS transporter [Paucibacter sp. DJ2R-2]|uniref:MFS transporter n=1 Tax=Paucibacter sp. DJ2R-2 TaxID=2893558 RepID=UPI0021E43F0D|nr:MFS transporter [Paucibacter sp. DJ2R-2]MCV2438567.1 MFS transporter [Paucibacter sp. DJ2R-2]